MKRVLAAFAIIAALLVSPALAADNIRSSAQPLLTSVNNGDIHYDFMANETVMGVEITGLTASGATLTIEGSTDGRRVGDAAKVWFSTVAIPFTCPSPSTFTTVAADGPFKIDISGLTNLRFRVSSVGTGTALVSVNGIPASTLGSCGGTGGGGGGGSVNIHDSAGNNLTSTGGALNVAGTFSATLGGFTASSSGARMTPFTVQVTDSSQILPTGAVSVVSNVGTTNPMYCNVNGMTATVADQLISPFSWFAFTIPATITTLHCIATGGTTTANAVGGAGLPTGASGGGGGGGGNVTIVGPLGTQSIAASVAITPATSSLFPISAASLPLPTGAATAANQEVTLAGTSATSAQGIQGVTNGVPIATQSGPDVATNTSVTAQDAGTTCVSTPPPAQTQCTGTATSGSFATAAIAGQQGAAAVASLTSGTVATVSFNSEFSWDGGATWYGRGLFLDSNPAPIWKNGVGNNVFSGSISVPPGATNWRVRAATLTGTSPNINIKLILSHSNSGTYVYNLPTAAAGISSVAAVNTQFIAGGIPFDTNAKQLAGSTLAGPTATGVAPSGGALVQNVNAAITSGTVTASFSQFAPNGNYATLTVGASSTRVALPTGTTVAVYNTGSNAAFVQFGSGSVIATATNDQIAPGGFNCFAVGSNVDIAAIETTGATTLNISGGAGGCAGSGGGGGGSSGNVFQANLFSTTGNGGTAATTQIFGPSGSLTIYLVNYSFQGQASTGTFQLVAGTGSNCASSQVALTPVWDMSTNPTGGEGPLGVLNASAPGAEVCAKTTGSNTITWRVGAVQQ